MSGETTRITFLMFFPNLFWRIFGKKRLGKFMFCRFLISAKACNWLDWNQSLIEWASEYQYFITAGRDFSCDYWRIFVKKEVKVFSTSSIFTAWISCTLGLQQLNDPNRKSRGCCRRYFDDFRMWKYDAWSIPAVPILNFGDEKLEKKCFCQSFFIGADT